MAFYTKKTDTQLAPATIVQNDEARPDYVLIHTTGTPVGFVLDSEPVYGGDFDNPEIVGYAARIVYGGGDHAVQIAAPDGYDGRIARFDVTQNGGIAIVSSGGHGSLVGLNPTWITWG